MERWNNTLRHEWVATFDKRCPFPNLMSIMTWVPGGLLFSIIWAYHLPSNHYPLAHRMFPATTHDQTVRVDAAYHCS
jgi:hypothetical protein